MTALPSQPAPDSVPGLHIATIAYEGLIWDAWLEFESDLHQATGHRARIRFEPPTGEGSDPTETAVIFIEDSYEAAVAKARSFDDRQLQNLLRSTLPAAD